jgi:branched-chain amino acid transport system permease protein
MIEFIQNLVNALSLGSLLSLAALGIGLLFGVLRLINFAHGDFITVAAFALIVPSSDDTPRLFIGDWPWTALVLGVCAVLVVVALASDWLVFRHLRKADPTTMMMASFAVGHVIQNVLLMIYTGRPKGVSLWSNLSEQVQISVVAIPAYNLVTIGATIALVVVLVLFLTRTTIGIQMRAAAEDFRMSQYLGVRGNFVIGLAFAISGILAAIVSLLYVSQTGGLSYTMGGPIALLAFMACVIGGMNSLVGAAVGGFIVGGLDVMLQAYLPDDLRAFRDAFVFGIVILMIIMRPNGLFPSRSVVSRV